MSISNIARVSAVALMSVVLGTLSLGAQGRGGGGMGMPRYDTATETTIAGTVESVKPHQGRGGGTGLHLSVKTDAGLLDVHVGPTAWLTQQGYTFAEHDAVEMTGSLVKVDGKDAFLAREIKKGDVTMTLRNADGRPKWSARGGATN